MFQRSHTGATLELLFNVPIISSGITAMFSVDNIRAVILAAETDSKLANS